MMMFSFFKFANNETIIIVSANISVEENMSSGTPPPPTGFNFLSYYELYTIWSTKWLQKVSAVHKEVVGREPENCENEIKSASL